MPPDFERNGMMLIERLTTKQREELEALALFGGATSIHKLYWRDRTIRSLIRRGLITWRRAGSWGPNFRREAITPKGRAAIRRTTADEQDRP